MQQLYIGRRVTVAQLLLLLLLLSMSSLLLLLLCNGVDLALEKDATGALGVSHSSTLDL